jgi:hypothetical protein
MAENSQRINFKDIDYQGLKTGLIEFLKNTQSFKDANFEGTFLSQLVNMLSYTGAIFGNYVNAMASEQYLNTSQLYETTNMLANIVGYKPKGFRGSSVSITIEPDFEQMGVTNIEDFYGWSAVIPRATKFATSKVNSQGKSLIFSSKIESVLTIKNPFIQPSGNANLLSLDLIQGIPMAIEFVSDGSSLQSFEIPNPFIDYENIAVYVINDMNQEEKWSSAITVFDSNADSKIYIPFINPKGLLEIMFSDGNFGNIPSAGKTIRIEYFITQGASGSIDVGMINSLIDNIYFVSTDYTNSILGKFTITQENPSNAGYGMETMDRIKKFAPLSYGMQNRLVNNFDYESFILKEYNTLADVGSFNYIEAVNAGLLRSPCESVLVNGKWDDYIITANTDGDDVRIPTTWRTAGFYQAIVVNREDTLPLLNSPKVTDLLNTGTEIALFADTVGSCDVAQDSIIVQNATIPVADGTCPIIQFEVEVMNPEITDNGTYPDITSNDIAIYINSKECFVQITPFEYNISGYVANACECERKGNISGWYLIKGIAFIAPEYIKDTEANIETSIVVKANHSLLLGEVKVFPTNTYSSNDVFIVPVPNTGGFVSTEVKRDILSRIDPLSMICVRNNIIRPKYRTFDVRVIFKKDESVFMSINEIIGNIKSKIVEIFLPQNMKLGQTLSAIEMSNEIASLPGLLRSTVILTPREGEGAEYLSRSNEDTALGNFQLKEGDFPILGEVLIG